MRIMDPARAKAVVKISWRVCMLIVLTVRLSFPWSMVITQKAERG